MKTNKISLKLDLNSRKHEKHNCELRESPIDNGTQLMKSFGFPLKNWRLRHVCLQNIHFNQKFDHKFETQGPVSKQLFEVNYEFKIILLKRSQYLKEFPKSKAKRI